MSSLAIGFNDIPIEGFPERRDFLNSEIQIVMLGVTDTPSTAKEVTMRVIAGLEGEERRHWNIQRTARMLATAKRLQFVTVTMQRTARRNIALYQRRIVHAE